MHGDEGGARLGEGGPFGAVAGPLWPGGDASSLPAASWPG